MRKLLVLFLALIIPSSCLAWGTKNVVDTEGKGYMGKLPDISRSFQTSEPAVGKPIFEATEKFNSANQVKPAPRDNPAFVNIILKTDKTSVYLNDVNNVIPMLEKILNSIDSKEDVQKFAAKVYFFNKTADYLRGKYGGLPESSYVSFKKMMELSMHAQSVSLLRSEAKKYSPYLAYTGAGYIYNSNNVDQQLEYLRHEIEQVIIVLKEAN